MIAVLTPTAASWQFFVGLLEAGQGGLHADALLGRLEDAKRRRLSGLQLVDQGFVHGELGDAAVRKTLEETQASRLRIVDPQAYARRKQHPERRNDAHETRLAIGGVENDDDQNQVRTVLVDDAEHDCALLMGRAGWRFAASHPIAVLVPHRPLRL